MTTFKVHIVFWFILKLTCHDGSGFHSTEIFSSEHLISWNVFFFWVLSQINYCRGRIGWRSEDTRERVKVGYSFTCWGRGLWPGRAFSCSQEVTNNEKQKLKERSSSGMLTLNFTHMFMVSLWKIYVLNIRNMCRIYQIENDALDKLKEFASAFIWLYSSVTKGLRRHSCTVLKH